jgi:hypothetical protein
VTNIAEYLYVSAVRTAQPTVETSDFVATVSQGDESVTLRMNKQGLEEAIAQGKGRINALKSLSDVSTVLHRHNTGVISAVLVAKACYEAAVEDVFAEEFPHLAMLLEAARQEYPPSGAPCCTAECCQPVVAPPLGDVVKDLSERLDYVEKYLLLKGG